MHFSPVNAVVAGPERSVIRFFSLAMGMTAPAVEEETRSAMTSTFSSSNHLRAVFEAMSALFWWSAEMISMFLPSTFPPKSSAAMVAASTEPGPARSA